jgi:hypothetical protein
MIEEQRFGNALQEVHPQIPTLQMRELVCDHRFEQVWRQFK